MNFLKKNIFGIIFALVGGVAGYLYWRFVGCESGTCPLKSVWYYSVFIGTLIGYLLGDSAKEMIFKYKKKTIEEENGKSSD
jgi:H+/Cl- antiporter ClcA